MRVYKCIISGDEMFNDSYNITDKGDEGMFVLKGKLVSRSEDIKLAGANPSAEDGAEDSEAVLEQGVDVIINSRLQETSFNKKSEYSTHMKGYFKSLVDKYTADGKDEEFIKKVKTEAQAAIKIALGKFKDLQFFTGESGDNDGHIALMEWVEEEVNGKMASVPYLYFYKGGLLDEKY